MTNLVGRHFHCEMLPFERASKKTWLGHIFVRNWRPNQKCTFWAGLPTPPQVPFYDSGPTGGTKPTPKKVFRMLIPFSMFLFESGEGKARTQPYKHGGKK